MRDKTTQIYIYTVCVCIYICIYIYIYIYPFYSKQDSQELAWISSQNRVELHEDIILRSPRFSTIERFLVSEGEGPFNM